MEKQPTSPESRKTILVVDDHVLVRQLIADVLSHVDGYNLLLAESGTEGLQRSREFPGEIHLLLTAFRMHGMSGISLATAMTVDRPMLKVLVMSALPQDMQGHNYGWHFLTRPFMASQLRALVAGLVFPDAKSRYAAPEPSE